MPSVLRRSSSLRSYKNEPSIAASAKHFPVLPKAQAHEPVADVIDAPCSDLGLFLSWHFAVLELRDELAHAPLMPPLLCHL